MTDAWRDDDDLIEAALIEAGEEWRIGCEIGVYENDEAFIREYTQSVEDLPSWLMDYVDWESVARDMMIDFHVVELADGRFAYFHY